MKPLFIHHTAPYHGHHAQESLDALLVMAAFGQNPSVLFQGDGVWQLLANQQSEIVGKASIIAQLSALELYDVSEVYVDEQSLLTRNLKAEHLAIDVQILSQESVKDFFQQHSPIIRL